MASMTLPQPATARRTRFKRATPEPMRLTDDDLTILRTIAKHRFLRSTHLTRLMSDRSMKKLIERLARLYHNGYVDRPRAQLDYYSTAGSAPMVYALGNRGALVLADNDGANRAQTDWTWKNRSAGRVFVEHALLTADVMIAAEQAARIRHDLRLIEPHEILAAAPPSTRTAASPFKLTTRVVQDGNRIDLVVIPDRVFGLDFTADHKRKYFFVEADRATMPITRSDLNQTSFHRKLLAYVAGGGKSNVFGKQLGVDNFRVLTVTTSRERTASMLDALRTATEGKGSQQFLFTDRATLRASFDLFSVEWITGKGDRVRLVD
jgi:hypothetical protein